MRIFLRVGSEPVAVFEIDPEVLHGFNAELLDHSLVNGGRIARIDTYSCGKLVRVRSVGFKRGKRYFSQLSRSFLPEQMCPTIYDVHRRPAGAIDRGLRDIASGRCCWLAVFA